MFTKRILSTAIIALAASSSIQAEEFEASVALGVMSESSPFIGVSNETMPVIAPHIEYGDFYWQVQEFGYEIFDNDKFELAAVFKPFEGYDVEASEIAEGYRGIEDRDGKFEFGFSASMGLGPVELEFTPTYNGEGYSAELEVSKMYFGLNHMIRVSAFTRYDSADYQNYYFGVTEAEANHAASYNINSAYEADSGISFGAQIIGTYDLSEKWYLIGMAEYTKLDSSIEDSPIVDETAATQFAIGVGYKF